MLFAFPFVFFVTFCSSLLCTLTKRSSTTCADDNSARHHLDLLAPGNHPTRFFDFIPVVHRHDDFTRLAAVVSADDPVFGHPINQSRPASISDPKGTL